MIIYTSGTTGRPKGAMLSHGNLLHNVESCRIVLQTVATDRFAVLLPLFHSYMLTVGLLLPLLVGGSMVLVKSLHPVRNVLQEILQRQATVLPAIPQFYRSMVNAPIHAPLPLRICISGAAPLPVQVLKEFEAKFQIPLIEGYGLSEASPVVTKNPLDGTRKAGSIGLPIPNVEVSIQDDAGASLGANEIGEVCVRGGNVMLGYWNQPEETAKVMRNGWLLTGDIGYRDAEGYYFITDRKKDMLLVNGINVYPREIEEVLYQFPGVKEAAVIGKPDPRKGEQPIAFVAANDGAVLEEKALQQFVRRKLADYKVPAESGVLARPAPECHRQDPQNYAAGTAFAWLRRGDRPFLAFPFGGRPWRNNWSMSRRLSGDARRFPGTQPLVPGRWPCPGATQRSSRNQRYPPGVAGQRWRPSSPTPRPNERDISSCFSIVPLFFLYSFSILSLVLGVLAASTPCDSAPLAHRTTQNPGAFLHYRLQTISARFGSPDGSRASQQGQLLPVFFL